MINNRFSVLCAGGYFAVELLLTTSSHVWEADKLQRKYGWAEVIARTGIRPILIKGEYQQK